MKFWDNILLIWALWFLLAGCSVNRDLNAPSPPPPVKREAMPPKQDLIVLLPEPDGKVGVIAVENAGGSQILNKPGQTTRVEDFHKAPAAPQSLDKNEITNVFGAALEAQPDLTRRFASFTLWFESDKTKLTDPSKATLSDIIRTIKLRKSNQIHIVGHTDRVGTDSHNLKLSARRANYVRDLFSSNGVKSSAFVVSFKGEAMPLIYTEDEVAEPLNRRVEVFIR
jgi:outer membrane protein OmpA-like peptidoglycan-associated protein